MKSNSLYWPVFLIILLYGCGGSDEESDFSEQGREVPEFSSDNAFQYIEDQVNFGPRVPNSSAHEEAVNYFRNHFQSAAGQRSVYIQSFQRVVYGDTLDLHNVLASFGGQYSDRIILAAHWDSRPRAEKDTSDPDSPISGADDGASGVGVLMELANIFAEHEPPVGVDIILFDGEDYGETNDLSNYFLGSRYWGENPPVPGYNPRFGILLDMVGGENALFSKEGYSIRFHPALVDEIWAIGQEMGYGHLFVNERGGLVSDDHVIVQRLTNIPMINIINHRVEDGRLEFPPYWHTHEDNMDIIDRQTLQIVGDVLLELIYNRISI
ncbi:MAG: M28 family peptidase [Balneolaceae bacterium]